MNNNEWQYAEVSLSPKQLQNIPESASPWFVQQVEGDVERAEAIGEMVTVIWRMAERSLTSRQKVIVHLRYQEQRTQTEIAGILGISQATVNHHLIGKVRRGKPIGGAMQRIRKRIRKEAAKQSDTGSRSGRLIVALDAMLDESSTRRHTAQLFRKLLGTG